MNKLAHPTIGGVYPIANGIQRVELTQSIRGGRSMLINGYNCDRNRGVERATNGWAKVFSSASLERWLKEMGYVKVISSNKKKLTEISKPN